MAFWKWSHTASSNATADSTINWAEGMAPSAVNNSARAMMARIAEWRDDISGTTARRHLDRLYGRLEPGFRQPPRHERRHGGVHPERRQWRRLTLNVDGLGAKPLRFGPGLDLPSGT